MSGATEIPRCPFCNGADFGVNSNSANAWIECLVCHSHGPEMVHGGRINKELEGKLFYAWSQRPTSQHGEVLGLRDAIAEKQQEIDKLQRELDASIEQGTRLDKACGGYMETLDSISQAVKGQGKATEKLQAVSAIVESSGKK